MEETASRARHKTPEAEQARAQLNEWLEWMLGEPITIIREHTGDEDGMRVYLVTFEHDGRVLHSGIEHGVISPGEFND